MYGTVADELRSKTDVSQQYGVDNGLSENVRVVRGSEYDRFTTGGHRPVVVEFECSAVEREILSIRHATQTATGPRHVENKSLRHGQHVSTFVFEAGKVGIIVDHCKGLTIGYFISGWCHD